MTFLVNTPYTPCLVRNEFLCDQKRGHGEFTEATVFAFRAEPARVPMFQLMTAQGAQWARIPIHALATKPCPVMALQLACWWDSFSRHCTVTELKFLRNHRVQAVGRDGIKRPGVYLFTVAWCNGGWAEISNQSKDHHIIALDSGPWIAYPNNKLLWSDPSWIDQELPQGWESPSDNYSVEAMP
jgi:hypothetical protein